MNEGITRIGNHEINFAKEKGYKIKLLASASKNKEDEVNAMVLPSFIRSSHQLFNVDDVYNGVITESLFADKQVFIGKGAGAHPTASAVLSDISALSYNYRYEFKKSKQQVLKFSNNFKIGIYLRWDGSNREEVEALFEKVNETYVSNERTVLCGEILIENFEKVKTLAGEDHCVIGLN